MDTRQGLSAGPYPVFDAGEAGLQIGRWNGHIFEVSPFLVYSFSDLQIKASSNTKEKSKSKQKYVARKSAKPVEVTLTVSLNRLLGCDVRYEAEGFISDAKAGKNDYMYIGNEKLIPAKLMLTDATISDIEITTTGTWVRATAKLTFKQGSKNDKKQTARTKQTLKSSETWMKISVRRQQPQSTGKFKFQMNRFSDDGSQNDAEALATSAYRASGEVRQIEQLAKRATADKQLIDAARKSASSKKRV